MDLPDFLDFDDQSPVKGALAGIVGGLAASWAMSQFQAQVPASAFKRFFEDAGLEAPAAKKGAAQNADDKPATVKTADAIAEGVFDHSLTKAEEKQAGPAVHYAFGASVGATYGVLAEYVPGVTAGVGVPFGAAVWAVADEAIVPALGLSKPPTAHPPSTHAYALVSHFVYGLVTEAVRRSVRASL